MLADGVHDAPALLGRQPPPHPEPGEQERDDNLAGEDHALILAHAGRVQTCQMRQTRVQQGFSRALSARLPRRRSHVRPRRSTTALDTSSLFASAIREHLELKARNSGLDGDMPLDPYLDGDTFENHPLFKSEEQARIEETLDGEPAAELSSERLPWPGEETVENAPKAPRSTRRSGPVARATSTGATDLPAGSVTPVTAASTTALCLIEDERLRRYAELAVRVGANVQPGQDVVVTCLVEHAEIARAIARESYRAGARHVVVLYRDLHLRRAAIELGPEEELGWSAPHMLDLATALGRRAPRAHLAHRQPESRPARRPRPGARRPRRAEGAAQASSTTSAGGHINWTIVSAPNEGWATQVFGEPDVERLWDAVATRRGSTRPMSSQPGASTRRSCRSGPTR